MKPMFGGGLTALALLSSSVAAAADRPAVGPAPAWVLPAEIPKVAASMAGVAVSVLLADEQARLSDQGTSQYVETVIHIGSSQGLGAGALALAWDPALETLVIHRYRIIRDGQVIDLLGDGSKLTVVRRETNLERATLDGQLTATLQPEDVRVGDTVDFAFTQTRHDPALSGRTQAALALAAGVPVVRARIRALWPSTKPVHWLALPGSLAPTERRLGSDRELLADRSDFTTARPPKGAPARFQAVNLVQISDMGSWADVSRLMAPLYAKAAVLAPGSPVLAEAQRIAATTKDPKARALAALKLVQEQVRYLLLGMDDGGYVPANADTTWSRRFGDCKGKTVLLLALLRELGIDAQPALVSSGAGDGLDKRLPMVAAFDHVLVRTAIAGHVYWLDGTRAGDRSLDQIKTPLFRWALPATAAGSDLVPLIPEALEQPESVTTLDLDASQGLDVPARATGTMSFKGDLALFWRVSLAQMPQAQREIALKDYWHRQYEFVTADRVATTDDAATGQFQITMAGTAKMDWERTDDRRYYQIDGASVGGSFDIARDEGPNKDAPFAVNFPYSSEWRESITLPNAGEGFALLGGNVDQTVGVTHYYREMSIKDGRLAMLASTRTLAPEFPYAEADRVRTTMAELYNRNALVRAPANYRMTAGDLDILEKATPTTADAFVYRGASRLDRTRYDDALKDFDAAVALDGKVARANGFRSLTLAYMHDARAEAAAAHALALDAKEVRAWHARGIVAEYEGRYADADAAFSKAIELWPEDSWALLKRASARTNFGRYEEAMADLDAASKLMTDLSPVRAFQAKLLMATGHPEDAMARIDDHIKLHPDDFDARRMRVELLSTSGHSSEATAAIDVLLAERPGDEQLLTQRAEMRSRHGDKAGAIADLNAVLARRPNFTAFIQRAQLRDPADRALWSADLDQATKLSPGDASVFKVRALIEGRAASYKAAEAALAEAERLAPLDLQITVIRIDLLRRQGRRDEVVALMEAQAKNRTPTPQSLNELCWAKVTMNIQLESALAECNAALVLAPGSPTILDSRALVRFRMGQLEGALADFDAALKLRPRQAGSLYGRALVKAAMGHGDGVADFALAREIAPGIEAEYTAYGLPAPAALHRPMSEAKRP